MLPIIADNHTGEHWWMIDQDGALEVKERRFWSRGETEEVSESRLLGQFTVSESVVEVQLEDSDRRRGERFTAAVFSPSSFAPAYVVPDWLPWASELAPTNELMSDRVFRSDDARRFRGEHSTTWSSPENGPGRREVIVTLALDLSLAEASGGDRCQATVGLELATQLESSELELELECKVEASQGEPWLILRLDDLPWWQVLEREVPEGALSSDLRSLAGSALSTTLYFHPERPSYLLGERANLRYGMGSAPASSAPK